MTMHIRLKTLLLLVLPPLLLVSRGLHPVGCGRSPDGLRPSPSLHLQRRWSPMASRARPTHHALCQFHVPDPAYP